MTTPPRAPDWYPDPQGKAGLMYWDGRQWHTDIPATSSADDQPAPQPIPTTPAPQRQTALIATLSVAAAVLLGTVGVVCYLLLKQSHAPQTQAPQAAPASSGPPAQAAPTSSTTPASRYFTTPSGKICQVTAQQVTCQTCVPGRVITSVATCGDPAPAVAVDVQGNIDHNPGDMSSPPGAQQLSGGQTDHVDGWTIVTSGGWARFINDSTGHGMAIAGQNFDSF